VLTTRSAAESHLYMDLHSCPACGCPRFERAHELVAVDGALVSRYRGPCADCGAERSFELALADEAEPRADDAVVYGGASPSTIIGPGQFLAVADRHASAAPMPEPGMDEAARRRGRAAMQVAVGTLREVLKFVPPGASAVPAAAFSSDAGRRLHAAEPGRFGRARLEAVLETYRELLRGYGPGVS